MIRYESENEILITKIKGLEQNNQLLKIQQSNYFEERENLMNEISQLREINEDSKNTINISKVENTKILKQIELLMQQNQSKEQHSTKMFEQVNDQQIIVNELKNELRLNKKRLESVLEEQNKLQESYDNLEYQYQQLDQEHNNLYNQYTLLQQNTNQFELELNHDKEEIKNNKDKIKEKDRQLNEKINEIKEKEKNIEELQKKYQEINQVIRTMEKNEKVDLYYIILS